MTINISPEAAVLVVLSFVGFQGWMVRQLYSLKEQVSLLHQRIELMPGGRLVDSAEG